MLVYMFLTQVRYYLQLCSVQIFTPKGCYSLSMYYRPGRCSAIRPALNKWPAVHAPPRSVSKLF